MRVENPLFTHVLFPVYVGILDLAVGFTCRLNGCAPSFLYGINVR
jgi:hypothetical protein